MGVGFSRKANRPAPANHSKPRSRREIKYNVICERSNEESRDKEMRSAVRTITLGFLVFLSLAAFADTLTGKVVKITDGDTRYVLDANYEQHKKYANRPAYPNCG